MNPFLAPINAYLSRARDVLTQVNTEEMAAIAALLKQAYVEQRTIFVMGNGGSGATASHMACDLNKGACLQAEKKFRVMALTDNMATILALGNDLNYDSIFVEQLKNFAQPGDVVIGISGSGNSRNVLRAIEYANTLGCETVAWCGYDGGKLKSLAKHVFHVRVNDMQLVEDLHMMLVHILMQVLYAGPNSCCNCK